MSLTEQDAIGKPTTPATQVAQARAGQEANMKDKPTKPVTVEVDEIPVATPKVTTPRALLIAAGKDPATRQLVRVQGKHQEPFTDPDQPIKVHENERFITTSTGSTPVS